MIKNLNIHTGAVWEGDCRKGWIEPNRRIYDYEMVFFSSGSCRVITENQTFFCKSGMVIIIPPCHEHCSIADTTCTRWCIHFDWFGDCPAHQDERRIWVFQDESTEFQPGDSARLYPGDDIRFPACFQLNGGQTDQLRTWFRQFFEISPDTLGSQLKRLGLFLQILGAVLDSSGHSEAKRERNSTFFHGKRLLDQDFTDSEIQIRDIAAELRITPNHLNKLFRQHLGITPRLYLQNRRLLYAETLLNETRCTVREVASQSGFSDPNYFIRCFKAKNGVTPEKFRSR